MKFRAVIMVFGCALILFTALHCAGVVRTITSINLLSDQDEVQLGDQMVVEIESKESVVEDPRVAEYIARHGGTVAGYLPPRSFGYTFKVLAGKEINAFATPGGHCYVYSGLIKFAGNEAGLMGVMGHECGHVAAQHIGKQLTKQYTYQVVASAVLGNDPSAVEKIAAGMLGTGVGMHFSRQDEYEADRLGVEAMIKAGYDPQGMIDFFEKLDRTYASSGGIISKYLSTHPETRDRITAMREQIASYSLPPNLILDSPEFHTIQNILP
jgi:predicted Zn-dependent protease